MAHSDSTQLPSSERSRTPAGGLEVSAVSVARRRHGRNELPKPPPRGLLQIGLQLLREPMFLLLLVAAALYLLLGDLGEALLLGVFALLSIGLVAMQERRSERAVEALRAMGSPQARVRRAGQVQRIAAAEIVVGDLLLVEEGERIAADGVLIEVEQLQVDESLLTGESLPVSKSAVAADAAIGDGNDGEPHHDRVYAGTLATQGHGLAQVVAVGLETRSGEIGRSLLQIEPEATRLQRSVGRLVSLFGALALAVSLALLIGYGWLRGDWMGGALAAIALAMAMLPEEFPMAMAIFFAMGAWRLSRCQVLARRSSVIEMLGAATVLCVDKTGTLTENRMALAGLECVYGQQWLQAAPDPSAISNPGLQLLLQTAQAASRPEHADPMDKALRAPPAPWPPAQASAAALREYPLRSDRLVFAQAHDADGACELAAKGAPEAVLALCGADQAQAQALLERVSALAAEGLRLLAVARARVAGGQPPADIEGLDWQLLGLVGLQDPLRESVPAAVELARGAGLRVLMMTGDYPQTALAIARQAGLPTDNGVLEGRAIADLEQAELDQRVGEVSIYARVQPAQKLRLVQALKRRGEVVAMTGDGVNDAPALKAAHIGIAMGRRGTDVAREAAAIVLLDDDFGNLVQAIRTGRRIFDNLRKVMLYIAAIHVPIAGLALLPLLFGLPPLLLPAHVVLTEMLIDPMCSIAFENEPEEPGLMRQPPRPLQEPLIGGALLWLAVGQGMLLMLLCLGLYALALGNGQAEGEARALSFVALTCGNLALIRSNASRQAAWRGLASPERRTYWGIAAGVSLILLAALWVAPLRAIFAFELPDPGLLALAAVAGFVVGLSLEWVKPLRWVQRALGVQSPSG